MVTGGGSSVDVSGVRRGSTQDTLLMRLAVGLSRTPDERNIGQAGAAAVTELIVTHGIDVNARNMLGSTALELVLHTRVIHRCVALIPG